MISNLFLDPIIPVFFIYGLAFFAMGMIVTFEALVHIIDRDIGRAMLVLAAFALIHGLHEWFEMFLITAEAADVHYWLPGLDVTRLVVLTASFLLLCRFGLLMLYRGMPVGSLGATLTIVVVWGVGVVMVARRFGDQPTALIPALDAWSRYSTGAIGGVLAGLGLFKGAQNYRESVPVVVRGWMVAGGALAIYGLIGQTAPVPSQLFPSTVYNADVFREIFGFPVQLLRATTAVISTAGLLVALRALERDRQQQFRAAQQQARQESEARQRMQKELLRHMVAAQEEERAYIARELHDQTGQTLTALRYRVEALQADNPVSEEQIQDLQQLTAQSLDDLRQLVTDLRPAQLDDLGLVAALHWLTDQVKHRFNLDANVAVEGRRQRLPSEVETALFRVAQEALTNVARHAETGMARVTLRFQTGLVTVEIRDKGVGFELDEILRPAENDDLLPDLRAWGIIGMQERMSSVGGRFHVISKPGEGTLICAMIPLPGETDNYDSRQPHTNFAG